MYMFYMYIIYDMHIFVKRFFENIFKKFCPVFQGQISLFFIIAADYPREL